MCNCSTLRRVRVRVKVALSACIRGISLVSIFLSNRNILTQVVAVVNGDHLYLSVRWDLEIRLPGLHKMWSPGGPSGFVPQIVNGNGRWCCTMFVFRPRRILDQMGGDLSECLGLIFYIGVEFLSNLFSNTDDTTVFAGEKCG